MSQNLSNLAVGARVKFGKYSVNGEAAQPIVWLVVAKSHSCTPAYPTNSITLLAEKLIDLRSVDAKEPTNSVSNRQTGGNNRYFCSNIDQWLNKDSAANAWYSLTHPYDASPNADRVTHKSEYVARPGFLNAFTDAEKNAILSTTIRCVRPQVDGSGYDDVSRKVFLPALSEVRTGTLTTLVEGAVWSYFNQSDNSIRTAYLTNQAFTNSPCTGKPANVNTAREWWVRTPNPEQSNMTYYITAGGSNGYTNPHAANGVRPALNLSSTNKVSDTTDSDGCYTMVWNNAPPAPTTLNLPDKIFKGVPITVSWSSVIDPDGDSVSYELECSENLGGTWYSVYKGTATTYNHTTASYAYGFIQYRVRAVDSKGDYSSYTTSAMKTISYNQAPVISGSDSNLGIKTDGFSQTYTVTDAESNEVTITEAIDGVQVRFYIVTLGNTNTFAVTGTTWLQLANGTHSMTITATDSNGAKSVRTYTFTKNLTSLSVKTDPMVASSMPTRIVINVTKNIPAEAIFTVEVCNNGNDSTPTWEDATSAVVGKLVYNFENKSKTADSWAVMIRVTVGRNGGEGACYISAIGGNFE